MSSVAAVALARRRGRAWRSGTRRGSSSAERDPGAAELPLIRPVVVDADVPRWSRLPPSSGWQPAGEDVPALEDRAAVERRRRRLRSSGWSRGADDAADRVDADDPRRGAGGADRVDAGDARRAPAARFSSGPRPARWGAKSAGLARRPREVRRLVDRREPPADPRLSRGEEARDGVAVVREARRRSGRRRDRRRPGSRSGRGPRHLDAVPRGGARRTGDSDAKS